MYFLLSVRHLAEWSISLLKGVVSAYARGPMTSGHYLVVGGGSWTGHTVVPNIW